VEQLAHGNCVLTLWTDSNAEVIDGAGVYFHNEAELAEKLRLIVRDRPLVEGFRLRARERSLVYSWDRVADQYEELLARLAKRLSPVPS
jgi:glycosyltransferase involved in cell wall biosynthesis